MSYISENYTVPIRNKDLKRHLQLYTNFVTSKTIKAARISGITFNNKMSSLVEAYNMKHYHI